MCSDKMIFPLFDCFEFQSTSLNQALVLKIDNSNTQSTEENVFIKMSKAEKH